MKMNRKKGDGPTNRRLFEMKQQADFTIPKRKRERIPPSAQMTIPRGTPGGRKKS